MHFEVWGGNFNFCFTEPKGKPQAYEEPIHSYTLQDPRASSSMYFPEIFLFFSRTWLIFFIFILEICWIFYTLSISFAFRQIVIYINFM